MFKGKQAFYKNEVCIYLVHELLINKKIDVDKVLIFTGISRQTLVRYVSTIKNTLADFGFYNVTVFYDRSYDCYRCSVE